MSKTRTLIKADQVRVFMEYCNRDVEFINRIETNGLPLPDNVRERGGSVDISDHGGDCCGMVHFHNFFGTSREEMSDDIKDALEEGYQSILVEAVLSEPQIKNSLWRVEVLEKYGFKEVTVFKNPNSGNKVHVYHRLPGPVKG